jgi:outer membrane protein OmpA-like peptidoglycan-associated protein
MFGVSSNSISFNDRIQNKATKFALVALLLPFLLIATSSPVAQAAPNPTQLSLSGGNFTLARDASANGDVITLTPEMGNKAGAAFSKNRIDVRETFTVTAELNLGTRTSTGADGIAFVLQPNSSTTLTSGGGIGYAGVVNAFAVEFDTWQNGTELANDHAGLMKNDVALHTEWGVNPVDLGEIEDGQWRKVEFSWIPSSDVTGCDAGKGKFTAKYDRNFDGDLTDAGEILFNDVCIALEAYFQAYGFSTYFGFTAATGGSVNLQQVRTLAAVATARVNAGPTINPIPNQRVRINSGAQAITVTVSDDNTTSAQWSVTQTSGTTSTVPTVTSTGYPTVEGNTGTFTLTYTPSVSTAGTSLITVTVVDADGLSASTTFTVTVSLYGITPGTRTIAGETGTELLIPAYTAVGFTPTGYAIDRTLPAGLIFNNSTGAISGTPTESMTATAFVITATNGSESATADLNLTISPGTRSLSPSPQTVLASRWVAITPTTAYTPVNFLTAPTYSISGAALPSGLTIAPSTGIISGTPTVARTSADYIVLASNVNGETETATVSIQVVAVTPAIAPSAQTLSGFTSRAMTASADFTATGFAGSPIRYALSGGTLPAGLTFNTSTGVISGTPTAVRTLTTYTVTATTSLGESASASISIVVSNPASSVLAYRIDFGTNTGSGYMNPQYAYAGSSVVLERNLYKKDGFTFAGWNTKADGTGTAYADGATFKIDSTDVILHAQWKLVQAKPTITWATPVAIQEGTALGATQLNALASVPGTYTYSPAAAAVLPVGKHTLKVTFVPTDPKFETIDATVEIEVLAKAKITWANPAAIVEGTGLSGTQLNATGSVPGVFTYAPAAGTVLPVGRQTLRVTFTPTDTRLSAVTAEVTVEVTAKPAVVVPPTPTEPAPTVITSKQKVFFAMSSFALNAKAKADLTNLANKALAAGSRFTVTVVGFTQPTAKDPNFRTLANNRAKAAANFLRSLGVKGSYSVTGVGQAPRNVPSSRYAEVTVVVQSR